MNILVAPVLIIISVISILIGLFLFFKPSLAIEIQRRFYEKINWRIEPVSMKKEIINTKIMGLFLIALFLATISCISLGIIK